VSEPIGVTAHHPGMLFGWGTMELAAERAKHCPANLKFLAEIRAAALIGCEYCLDIGSMLAREGGVREEQLRDLHRWRQSEHFDDAEREALELAEGMTRTPVAVSDELVAALRERLGERALVELVSIIALENYRARFNWAFDIGAEGFSEGKFCPVPVADEETTRPQPEETAAA
jgi:4-carboxymuconolactone decarboxylase